MRAPLLSVSQGVLTILCSRFFLFRLWSHHQVLFFFSSRRRHTRLVSDWSSDVCSSDLVLERPPVGGERQSRSVRDGSDSRRGRSGADGPLRLRGYFFSSASMAVVTFLSSGLTRGSKRSEERRGKECGAGRGMQQQVIDQ